ncbi:hypothetical protein TWF718_005257 [Orbilia javanica]|uniref:Uncharacterized protein n=1 Tax=Orbilia javanica TaxID=47235 RepID=A0AAN8N142_9PEZI
MKIATLFTTIAIAAGISAQAIDPAEPILPTIITIKPPLTRSLTLVTLSPRPTLITTLITTKSCGPCPISTTSTVTIIYKRPPICPEYLCYPCEYLQLDKREEAAELEKRQLPTTTVSAPCCCATLPPTTATVTDDGCPPNPCACAITTTVLPTTCLRPSATLY